MTGWPRPITGGRAFSLSFGADAPGVRHVFDDRGLRLWEAGVSTGITNHAALEFPGGLEMFVFDKADSPSPTRVGLVIDRTAASALAIQFVRPARRGSGVTIEVLRAGVDCPFSLAALLSFPSSRCEDRVFRLRADAGMVDEIALSAPDRVGGAMTGRVMAAGDSAVVLYGSDAAKAFFAVIDLTGRRFFRSTLPSDGGPARDEVGSLR